MKKRKLKTKPIIILVLVLLAIVILVMFLAKLLKGNNVAKIPMLLASDIDKVDTYNLKFDNDEPISRGEKVIMYKKEYKNKENEKVYNKIRYNEKDYYIDLGHLVNIDESPVLEKEFYFRFLKKRK